MPALGAFRLKNDRDGALEGIRFGMASAVISAVVLVLSLRPLHRFRIALVASLVTIALVDSMADAYALFNAAGDPISALASVAAKLLVCGSLAALAYYGARDVRGSGSRSIPTPASRRTQIILFAAVAVFAAGQLALTVATSDAEHVGQETALLAALFVGAVLISLGMNKLVSSLEK